MIWLIINGPKCAMWVMPCLQVLRVWHCSNVLFWCLQKCKNLPIWHTSARSHVFPWKSSTGALSRAWFAERVQTCRRAVGVFHIWLECGEEPQLAAGYGAADVCCRASSPGTDAGGSFNLTVSVLKDLISTGFQFSLCLSPCSQVEHPHAM